MDLESLKKFDFKKLDPASLDLESLLALVTQKKDYLGLVICGLLVVILPGCILKDHGVQAAALNKDISGLQEKVDVVRSLEKSKTRNAAYLKSLPAALNEEDLSAAVADLASANEIDIRGFVPKPKKSLADSEQVSLHLEVETKSYKNFVRFLAALEKIAFSLRIDEVILIPANDNLLEATIEMSSVRVLSKEDPGAAAVEALP